MPPRTLTHGALLLEEEGDVGQATPASALGATEGVSLGPLGSDGRST